MWRPGELVTLVHDCACKERDPDQSDDMPRASWPSFLQICPTIVRMCFPLQRRAMDITRVVHVNTRARVPGCSGYGQGRRARGEMDVGPKRGGRAHNEVSSLGDQVLQRNSLHGMRWYKCGGVCSRTNPTSVTHPGFRHGHSCSLSACASTRATAPLLISLPFALVLEHV